MCKCVCVWLLLLEERKNLEVYRKYITVECGDDDDDVDDENVVSRRDEVSYKKPSVPARVRAFPGMRQADVVMDPVLRSLSQSKTK